MEVSNQSVNPPQNPIPIQEQVQTPLPNPVSNKSRLKLPILIAGIVIFFLVVGGVFAAFFMQKTNSNSKEVEVTPQPATSQVSSPTPTTTDWKTYTSPSGYTIQYPPDFQYKESSPSNVSKTDSEEISFWKSSEGLGEYMGSGKYFTVKLLNNENAELKTWLKTKWLEYDISMDTIPVKENLNKVVDEAKEVDINGQTGLFMKHPYDESVYLVFIQGGNRVGKFTCIEYSPGIAENCEKAYKTFSFTK